jgi:NTE family protein
MSTKQILILQGGGALGAYECGVYQALAPHLDELAVVAGTSIGAINASLIAKHYHEPDRGTAFLKKFWMEKLATPSVPFFGLFGDLRRWNAVWTQMLFGHPHMYSPCLLEPMHVFRPPVSWFGTHFYDTQHMEQLLREHFGSYGPGEATPRLIVTAVDIRAGESKAFDSLKERITPAEIVACGSLPPGFPAKEIGKESYWDGGVWCNTPLRSVLSVMQGPAQREIDEGMDYHAYFISLFPKKGRIPQNNWEVWQRLAEINYTDRLEYEQKVLDHLNAEITLRRALSPYVEQLPEAQRSLIQQRTRDMELEKRVQVVVTLIKRESFPDEEAEHVSRELDFSPERVEELMEQGRRDAERKLSKEAQQAASKQPASV